MLYKTKQPPLNDKVLSCQISVTVVLHGSSAFFLYRSTCKAKEICALVGTGTA